MIGARSGLWFFDENKRTFSTDTVLTNDSLSIPVKEVAALQRDNEGNIWAGCNAGVIRFSPDMKDWKFYRRGEETGLAGNETYAILSTSVITSYSIHYTKLYDTVSRYATLSLYRRNQYPSPARSDDEHH